MGFFRRSRAANSAVPGTILRNINTLQDFMAVIDSCKNKEDPLKMKALEW